MNDSQTYALDRESQESYILDQQDGHPEHCRSASIDEEDEELPIHVPDYPTCPHTQVLEDETQVEDWIEARAMEFAFTKHGERKPKKPLQEVDECKSWSSAFCTVLDCGFDSARSKPVASYDVCIVTLDPRPTK